jgi:hypothetical protein
MRRLCRAGVLLCGLAAGCATRRDTQGLEAELRGHEDRILVLEQELRRARQELLAARREADFLRSQAAHAGEFVLTTEQANVLFRAEGLRINTLLTGGIDEDDSPGDDLLSLVLEPFDAQGQTLKLPGDVSIELLDPAEQGDARQVGHWNYTSEEVRDAWHSGLLVHGFRFRLPWQRPPRHAKLVVHARLTTPDGRVFDATETVKVAPPVSEPSFAAR